MYRTVVTLATCLLIVGCTLEEGEPPTFTAPSEFALSVTMTATPDQLPRDGTSHSILTFTVRDASGRPVAGQRLSVSASSGRLSDSSVTTDSNGQATVTFTAPVAGTVGNTAVIRVIPVGTDGANAASRDFAVLFIGGSNATRPTFATPPFVVTPTAPEASIAVRFDASTVTDEGSVCLDACSYSWNFGDGGTGSGRIVSHTYSAGRVYTVTLTVTDPSGTAASAAREITVTAPAPPTVTLSSTPNPPLAGQLATLAATVTAVTGRSIVRYQWTFGDGTSETTTVPTTTHSWTNQGTYVATVTATNDLGQTGSASIQLNITGSAVGATIVFSPTDPSAGQRVHFRAVNPAAPNGATISSYEWNFGDSEVSDGGTASGQSVSHIYSVGDDTYVVRLTLTDSNGNVGVVRAEVAVE